MAIALFTLKGYVLDDGPGKVDRKKNVLTGCLSAMLKCQSLLREYPFFVVFYIFGEFLLGTRWMRVDVYIFFSKTPDVLLLPVKPLVACRWEDAVFGRFLCEKGRIKERRRRSRRK